MAEVNSDKQVRIWKSNLKRLNDMNAALPVPYSLNQLANFVIREHLKIMDGKPKKK